MRTLFNSKLLLFFTFCFAIVCTSCLDDDDAINNNSSTQTQIRTLMQSGVWIISNFNDSGNNETGHFSCYSFIFNSNGSIVATNGSNTYNGTWSITNSSSSSDDLDFNIFFNLTNAFEDLNDDWDIVSYNSNSISLIDISGGNGGTDLLSFQIGTPNSNCNSQLQNTIQTDVEDGMWRITYFEDSGVDNTSDFAGYNFNFNNNGNLLATNNTNTYNGTWSVTDSNSNDDSLDDLDFNIFFNLTNDFEDLNDDWDIISNSATKIELIDISGGGGGTDYLTFEKN